ncbi:MAG: hypothetical protein ACR2HF_15485 [Methylococcaceae bacterium]
MTGRIHAAGTVLLLTFLSWVLPLLSLFAVAALALPTLRNGPREGGIIALIALIGLVTFGGYLLGSPINALSYGLLLWGPAWMTASAWRVTGKMSLAVMVAAAIGIMAVLVAYVLLDSPATFWMDTFREIAGSTLAQAPSPADRDDLLSSFMGFAPYLTGLVALGSVVSLTLSLFMARWWQSMLYYPGGFGEEFKALTLPKKMAYGVIALVGVALASSGVIAELTWNIIQPCFVPFILSGFAVLHIGLGARNFWLYGIYVLLLIVPYILLPILILGLADTVLNIRQRLTKN